jgi:PAS domain S-box-containing protein
MLSRSARHHPLFILLLVGAGFAAASLFSHACELPDARIVLVWLSAGVLFGAMARMPGKWWPAVFAMGFTINLALLRLVHYENIGDLGVLLLAATANNLDPLLAAILFRRAVGTRFDLGRLRDAAWLVAACCIGASLSGLVTTFIAMGLLTDQAFPIVWLKMTLSTMIGSPLAAWVILSWTVPEPIKFNPRPWIETTLLTALAVAIVHLCFRQTLDEGTVGVTNLVLVLPVLTCIVVRWDAQAASASLFVIVAAVVLHAPRLDAANPSDAAAGGRIALGIQVFLAVATSCTLLGAAISAERRTAMDEQRRNIAELSGTKDRLERLVEASPIATTVLDAQGIVHVWNKAAEETFGWTAQEVLGKPTPLIPPDDPHTAAVRQRLQAGQTLRNIELTRRRKDGRLIPVNLSASPYRDADGTISSAVLLYADMTAFHEAQSRLQRERDFNAAILNTVGALVVVLDVEGRFILFNRASETCSGYTAQEVTGRPFAQFLLPPDQIERTGEFWNGLLRTRVHLDAPPVLLDNEWLTKDGRRRHISWSCTLMGQEGRPPRYVIGTGIDLTEQRRAEGALRAVVEGTSGATGEAFFHNLVTQLARTMGVRSAMLCVRDGNKARSLAYWDKKVRPNISFELTDTPGAQVLLEGPRIYPHRARSIFPRDPLLAEKEVESYMAVRLSDRRGRPVGFLALLDDKPMEDVSLAESLLPIFANRASAELDRLGAEQETERLGQLLQNMIDSMPSTLAGVDGEGSVTHWNRQAVTLTGVEASRAIGRPLHELLPAAAQLLASVPTAMASRSAQHHERVPWQVGGERRLFDVTVYPLVAGGIDGAVVRLDDVTAHVRMQEVMIQTEKMMSIGGLAAGMAHEINNPLAGMMQSAQVIQNRLRADLPANLRAAEASGLTLAALHDYAARRGILPLLDAMRETGQRAAKIVDNMLRFSRKDHARMLPVDLPALLDKTIEIARSDYDLRKKYDFMSIDVRREYEPGLPPFECQETEIQQVILNLVKNAAEAMFEPPPSSGVGAAPPPEAQRLARPTLILRLASEGEMVRIEVEDNGPGMTDAVRRRVFEPFFTTKGVGVGTGLGLPVSYFIVTDNHGGSMTVESEPGRGARFIILLPRSPRGRGT